MQKEKESKGKKIPLIEMRKTWFSTEDGRIVNLEFSSPQDFDAFISKYLEIEDVNRSEWDLIIRWQAVNFAIGHGHVLKWCDPPVAKVKAVKNG